jgi:hypothetical protein
MAYRDDRGRLLRVGRDTRATFDTLWSPTTILPSVMPAAESLAV